MKLTLRLNDLDDVKKFVDITSRYDEQMTLVNGDYEVDAKSILGVYSMDLSETVCLVCDLEDEALKRDLKPFTAA